jgi:hypothetical protein
LAHKGDERHDGDGRDQDRPARIIDYIFSPLVEVASTAMKER